VQGPAADADGHSGRIQSQLNGRDRRGILHLLLIVIVIVVVIADVVEVRVIK
jgi:hypothetical protein